MKLIQTGSRDSKIVLVGEAPGANEVLTGVPFTGGAGELLDRALARANIYRSECFITNICHVRPPDNDFTWFVKPKPRPELLMGLVQLKTDLEAIKPNIVVCLGAWPLRFITGKIGIDKWRGSLLTSVLTPNLKVVGTYHPAYCMRIWDFKAILEIDLRRVRKHSHFPELRLPERDYILNPSREALLSLLPELSTATWLGTDIETWEAQDGKFELACVGFSDRCNRAVVIPANEEWKRDAIRELLLSQAKKIFQNGPFDYTVLTALGYVVNNWSWDTMFAHHARYPECAGGDDEMSALSKKRKTAALKKGLAFQTSIYTEEPYYKDDGKLWKKEGDINLFWLYNGKDAAVTREIKDVQANELAEFGTQHIADEALEQSKALIQVTNRGIKIDLEYWPKLRVEYVKEVENLQAGLNQLCGESVNVKSSAQMQKLLYTKLNLPVKYSRKTHNPTADKDAINELAGKYSHPILKFILEIRERRDFIERYMDVSVDKDGRMRCSFDVTGTKSGRLSSRASIWGSGTNLQNIPSRKLAGQKIRRGFVPDDGKVFVNRDLSQAEARLVAVLARCDRLIELFEDSTRDVHTENASRIFRIPLDAVTFENRYLAKRVVHASNYGMGPDRLVQLVAEDAEITGVRIDHKQAQELIDKYFMLYPEIKTIFWKEVEDELRHSRCLNTPFGRKREFFGRWDDKLLRDAYSYIPQSTIGDMGRKALLRIYNGLEVREGICQVLLNVHDSVMVQCLPEKVVEVSDKMEELMRFELDVNGRKLIVPSDCKVGLNWMERPKKQPELNPEGLRDIKIWLKEYNAAQTIKLD